MHNIIYTQNSLFNMASIIENIVQYTGYESSGLVFQEDIEKNVEFLSIFPEMGVDGVVDDTKEIFVNGYRVVYSFTESTVFILTVIHCKMLYPPLNQE
ncbi:type II toxin-antitoxin system RelE/ParE family toxin [Salmonella enterica subsp. enterica serovar Java]|nr:type II toxin-antitoxin system RelE/ParE family toxin [Salmonella enterica subsp. enterica serovar Java]EHN1697436.1 type II toxin-antitoxin system RelE/ParE family toxin [Salmonella enterica subsp. enterica serovar Newport]EJC3483668.1 type II toxin-antitoxin system RelE/ParE family toxin [Salmonella enterica]